MTGPITFKCFATNEIPLVKEIQNLLWIQVLAGEHDVTVAQGETRHKVARIIDHPRYNRSTLDYDFSILELYCDDKIDLTDKARAACLPSGNDSPRYESAATFNVSGWGHLVIRQWFLPAARLVNMCCRSNNKNNNKRRHLTFLKNSNFLKNLNFFLIC